MVLKHDYASNDVLHSTDFNAVVVHVNSAEQTANKGQPNGYAALDAGGKVPASQLPASLMEYQGVWNASTNTPTLANGVGNTGDVYRVSVGGAANLGSGSITYDLGDYVLYNGTAWEKSDTTDAVATVAGRTGNVTLTKADVGLSNVDNTSDATKNAAAVALTNKTSVTSTGTVTGNQLASTVATGTAPLTVTSTTQVNNLNSQYLGGSDLVTLASSVRASGNWVGGGTFTVSATGSVFWNTRIMTIGNGSGTTFAPGGYYQIDCPTSGTITGVGGATNKTATAAGIPLGDYEALYYILPLGQTITSLPANFRVVSYFNVVDVPHNWVRICFRNNDTGVFTFNNGINLSAGESLSSIQQAAINTPNTLVRRDGSGNFLAGTIGLTSLTVSSSSLVANLNADLLDGLHSATANTVNTVVARDANGDTFCRYGMTSYVSMSHTAADRTTDTVFYSSTDNYIRKNTATGFKTSLALNNVNNTADAAKNVLSATKLTTARTINGVAFDGTQNITVPSGLSRTAAILTSPTTLPAANQTDYAYLLSGTPGSGLITGSLLTGDPHWNSVSSLLHFDGINGATGAATVIDSAPNPVSWTTNAGSLNTTYKKFGTSSIFYPGQWGATTYAAASPRFNISGTSFTIEGWVFFSGSAWGAIYNLGNPDFGSSTVSPVQVYVVDGQALRFQIANAAVNSYSLTVQSPKLNYNEWHHHVVQGNGTRIQVYVNGALQGSCLQPAWTSVDRNWKIASNYPDPLQGGTAYLDEMRFTKGVARYSGNSFNVPTTAFPETTATYSADIPAVAEVKANVTLPTAVGNTSSYTLKNIYSDVITVSTTSSQTIEQQTTLTIAPGQSYTILSDNSNWRVL